MNTGARRGRVSGPELPSGEIVVQAPPPLAEPESAGDVLATAVPMLGGLGSVAVMATMSGTTSGGQERSVLAGAMFLVATLAFVVAQLDRQRTRRLRTVGAARTAYLRHLGTVREAARAAAAEQRAALVWQHPHPSALPALAAEGSRVWERSATDADFLHVRYGVSTQPLSRAVVPPEAPVEPADPVATAALHRLLAVHRTQPDLPVTVNLLAGDRIEVCGDEEEARALARSLICSAVTFHAADLLAVAVLASDDALVRWDWVKWLPHALSRGEADAAGPRRLVSTDLAELLRLLSLDPGQRSLSADPLRDPHVLLIVDGGVVPHAVVGVTVLDLPRRWGDLVDNTTRLLFADRGGVSALQAHQPAVVAEPDRCDQVTAEALARRLLPLRRTSDPSDGAHPWGLAGLMSDVRRFDPVTAWQPRPMRDRLRAPIGLADDGATVHLDLKESAQHGMGPHGLLVGATGSGKSELLRTLVLGLALTHSPEELNLVLVDFKGGATFAGMSAMPHVSALITNLADDLALVDRMYDALSGEMVRRQEVLRDAGNVASVRDYERARTDGADLVPLPSLFIVIDEFSEMLAVRPELLELFVAIGRLGRSLGLHLLLAAQRLEEGRLRGLESHLSYRIGLRTFSAHESRAVLGVPDAYELPPLPGTGFLKDGRSAPARFTATYVSGPMVAPPPAPDEGVPRQGIVPWTATEVPLLQPATQRSQPRPARSRTPMSLLTGAVARMRGCGPPARRIWLPPLDAPDTLDRLMPDLAPDPVLGLVSRRWRSLGGLTLPLGTLDRPREQRRDPLTVDLAGGHVAVVGGPRSGKSTLLRTAVTALSMTTTPLESQVFVLDFGGGAFAALQSLPHLAGLGTRSEPDVVRRIVAEVSGIVDRRETYFRRHGIDAIETYRNRRAQGRADDGYGDVLLVVDGWSGLRADFDDLEVELQVLASRALTFGVHLVTASSRWADYRAAVRDLFGTRLELRLGDPTDSELDRRSAASVPVGRPGRGLVPGGLHFLGALPRIDGDPDVGSVGEGVERLVGRVTEAWHGPVAPQLRLLPDRITATELLDHTGDALLGDGHLVLGIDEKALRPVGLDPGMEPHWLVFGDGGSGKSSALRAYVHEVMRTHTPQRAQIVAVDYRRSLLGEVPDAYLLHYLTSGAQAAGALAELADHLERRIPGPDVTPEQLRHRSWWTGAEVFVVVDDYDLVTTQHSSPVHSLVPLLGQARDVGLHLALARRAGGASRALYEPVLSTLRDLAAPGLVLSGSPDEGALVGGIRPAPSAPGRGRLVTRDRGVDVVQVVWRAPAL